MTTAHAANDPRGLVASRARVLLAKWRDGGVLFSGVHRVRTNPGLSGSSSGRLGSGLHPIYHEEQFSYDIRTLKARGVHYVVLSSAHYPNVDPTSEDQLYLQPAHEARFVARFSPRVQLSDAGDYPVSIPTITVYELPRPFFILARFVRRAARA